MSRRYISNRASAYGRNNQKPATKHIAREGNTTECGRKMADPYSVSSMSEHALCEKCRRACYCMAEADERGMERVVIHSLACPSNPDFED